MKYDLFVSDFDGTLGEGFDVINEKTVAAIYEYVEKGGKFAICTGRLYDSIKSICDKYSLKGTLISYQGAYITDMETGKELLKGGIDRTLAATIAKELLRDGLPAIADIDDVMYYEKATPYTEFHKRFAKVVQVNSVVEAIANHSGTIFKLAAMSDVPRINKATKEYGEKYKGKVICNNGAEYIIEIINPQFSKGNAVKFLSEYYKIPYERIITVGDSTNDIEMIKGGWHGVAVGDGREELKKVADEITVPYAERPVEVLLRKYCL